MASLKCYPSILNPSLIAKLKDNRVVSVVDFIHETPENLNKITNLRFSDILETKQKLLQLYRGPGRTGLQLYHSVAANPQRLPSAIPELDEMTGGLQTGVSYELYGLSASGKTQICLRMTAHAAYLGFPVHFIDTKNEFSPSEVHRMLRECDKSQKITADLSRIVVTKVRNLYQLVSVLHRMKKLLAQEHIPLVVIDCISTLYFLVVGEDEPVGLGLLNHVASLIKYITTEFRVCLVVTNLAAKQYRRSKNERQENKIKPCLGNYWSHVCDVRINVHELKNFAATVQK